MTDAEKRQKVIKGLECCMLSYKDGCEECPYVAKGMCQELLGEHVLALLKKSFTPQEVYDTVVEHAQHDMRFKLGDKIDYSFTDVVDILNIEVMCRAGDM